VKSEDLNRANPACWIERQLDKWRDVRSKRRTAMEVVPGEAVSLKP